MEGRRSRYCTCSRVSTPINGDRLEVKLCGIDQAVTKPLAVEASLNQPKPA